MAGVSLSHGGRPAKKILAPVPGVVIADEVAVVPHRAALPGPWRDC
jgi:hypothetical protein